MPEPDPEDRYGRAARRRARAAGRWAGPPWTGERPPWTGERPPWWPENEPWPPQGGPPWARRRRTHAWPGSAWWAGFGCLFALAFLVLAISVVGLVVFVLGELDWVARLLGILAILGLLALTVRSIRGTGVVLDDLLDATRRVEAGDYSARVDVPRRGPRALRELVRGFDTMTERLERDEAQRRSLLADVGHELRTPLAVLQGNLEAIVDGVHPADEAHLGALVEETRVLTRLIEDLRTIALSEAGTLALHPEPTDVGIVAADVATSFRATATTAGVDLRLDLADDLPLLDADPVRLREVLANLVSNALRATPPGGVVTLAARVVPAQLELTVADTGPGIAPDLLPRVFDRFAKGAGSGGSGLGLAIAKALVEAHGGTLGAASDRGRGTTMTVRLPLE